MSGLSDWDEIVEIRIKNRLKIGISRSKPRT